MSSPVAGTKFDDHGVPVVDLTDVDDVQCVQSVV